MKKLIALLLACLMVISMAAAEEPVIVPEGVAEETAEEATAPNTEAVDVTYKALYLALMESIKEKGDENFLTISDLSVWKINDTLAGFSFQGEGWLIYGEADMNTGIIKKILCDIPYTKAGLMTIYMVAYVLSEEADANVFISKYAGEDSVLKNEPFPNYAVESDAGNETTVVCSFVRTGEITLKNEENACDMKPLIESIQKPSAQEN